MGIQLPTSTDILLGLRFRILYLQLSSPNYHNHLYGCNVEYWIGITKSKAKYDCHLLRSKVALIIGIEPPDTQHD